MTEKTILIVDDMQFDRELLSRSLLRKINCKIVECSSGEEALTVLAGQKIDLVLLDVDMPIMTGDVLVCKIRENSSLAELPIIMISGKLDDSIIIKCLKAGANDYISKPVKIEMALSRITNHLRLSESIDDRVRLRELAAFNAMVATYNHEINNPLAIALARLSKLESNRSDDESFRKIEHALGRIAEIVKLIEVAQAKKHVIFEDYVGTSKMVKLRNGGI